MSKQIDALKLALEALKKSDDFLYNWHENYSDDEADAYAAARQLNEQAIIAAEKALMSVSDGAQQSNEQVESVTFDAWYERFHSFVGKSPLLYSDLHCAWQAAKLYTYPPVPTAQPDCTRSHPHEEMSKECELRTEIARLTNELARLKAKPKEPEQEPVAWRWLSSKTWKQWSLSDDKKLVAEAVEWLGEEKVQPLYTTPPQRKPLTDEQIDAIADKFTVHTGEMWEPELCIEFNDSCKSVHSFARAIEAAHGIKE